MYGLEDPEGFSNFLLTLVIPVDTTPFSEEILTTENLLSPWVV